MDMTGQDDEKLVAATLRGDAATFEVLVRRHYAAVFAVALARLRNPDAAEELAQEAFVSAYLNLDRLRKSGRFPAWVCSIARNLALKWIRNGTRRSQVLEKLFTREPDGAHTPSPADALLAREEARMLRTALDKLPADQREAVLLHYAEDLSKKDVAARMGVHPSTAGRLLERALSGMKKELQPTLREVAPALRPGAGAIARAVGAVGMAAGLSAEAKAALAVGSVQTTAVASGLWSALKWPAIIVTLCAGAAVVGPPLLRWGYLQTRPPQMRIELENLRTVPVSFPQEWIAEANPSDADDSFLKLDRDYKARNATIRELLDNQDRLTSCPPELFTLTGALAPLLEETSRTVKGANYRMYGGLDVPRQLMQQNLARVCIMQSRAWQCRGEWGPALDSGLLPVRMARRPMVSNMITHLMAQACINIGVAQVQRVVADCPDALLLKHTLNELNHLRLRVILDVLERADILEQLWCLSEYRRMGITVDTTPGHPYVFYFDQVRRHRKSYLENQLLKLVPGTPEYTNLKSSIEREEKMQSGFQRFIGMEAAMAVVRPNTEESATRERVVTARYDLLRLFVAQRIETLEGRTSTPLAELKLRYFATDPPSDPFTGADFPLDPATGSFYSVGPDKADNTAAPFQYDATNGTISSGDLRNPALQ